MLPVSAHAQACGGLAQAGQPFSFARVRGAAPRLHFVRPDAAELGCPNGTRQCRARAFVVPGDVVVLSGGEQDGFRCASFTNARGQSTTGWLPSPALVAYAPSARTAAADWVGRWISGPEQRIVITSGGADGVLRVQGDATWGGRDPRRVGAGAVRTGSVEGTAAPRGDTLAFTMGSDRTLDFAAGEPHDCRVTMRLGSPYLVVQDNNDCGGVNVTFTGVYRRQP